jgi:hypothetical protein
MWRQWLPVTAATLALSACNPYYRFTGDSSAGAVDPVNFPAGYVGLCQDPVTGLFTDQCDGKHPGTGQLGVGLATDGQTGAASAYYPFPFTGTSLDVAFPGDINSTTPGQYVAPLAYNFDEDGSTHCLAPKNYVYDQQTDQVRLDQQGAIFTAIPDGDLFPDYQPIVADVPVQSGPKYPCQGVKSDDRLVKRKDIVVDLVPATDPNVPGAHATGKPSGVLYARPVFDPSLSVTFPDGALDPNTGLGPQQWGWYGRYLVAWLDGGTIPTFQDTVTDANGNPQTITGLKPQVIYFPDSHPGTDENGNPVVVQGALGDGFDIISASRGTAGYSPLCQVFTFTPTDPTAPPTTIAQDPADPTAGIDMSTAQPTGEYIWCIQLSAAEDTQ